MRSKYDVESTGRKAGTQCEQMVWWIRRWIQTRRSGLELLASAKVRISSVGKQAMKLPFIEVLLQFSQPSAIFSIKWLYKIHLINFYLFLAFICNTKGNCL